jgi:IS30 family transposase
MADKIRLNTRTGSKHKHMVIEDREEIEVGLNQGLSLKELGYALHRDPGTIRKSEEAEYSIKQYSLMTYRITASPQRLVENRMSARRRTAGSFAETATAAGIVLNSFRSSARNS